MRHVLTILVLILGLGACGAEQDRGPHEVGKGDEADSKAAKKKRPKASADDGKKWGGWRWKGTRDDCFFRVGKGCFDSFEKACKGASCGKRKCLKDDGAPAKVYCEGDKPDKADSEPKPAKSKGKGKGKGDGKKADEDEDEEDEGE